MMRLIRIILALTLLAGASAATAQSPFSAVVRGGAAFPSDFGDAELGTGFGFGATLEYRLPMCLALYAGWDWFHFTEEGTDLDIEDTGYAAGLRWTPVRLEQFLGPWLLAGALYKHVEIEDDNGDIVADSDHVLGFEAGGGVTLRLTDRLALLPGVRYRTFSPEMEIGGVTADAEDLSYVALELGLSIAF